MLYDQLFFSYASEQLFSEYCRLLPTINEIKTISA